MVGGMMVSWRALAAALVVTAGMAALPTAAAAADPDDMAPPSAVHAHCTPANTLNPGTPRSGQLRRGDRELANGGTGLADVLCMPVTAGQRVSVRVQGMGTSLFMLVGGQTALRIESCEDCATDYVEPDGVGELTVIARETGFILMVVGVYDTDSARYAIMAEAASNPAPVIRALSAGAPVRGTLTTNDWIDPQAEGLEANRIQDVYTLQLRAGRPVEVNMAAAPGNERLDPYLVLGRVGPDGRLVDQVSDDDGGPGLSARIRYTPTVSGTYQLRARALSGEAAGAYTVQVGPVTSPPRPRATPLVLGQSQSGSIGPRSPLAEDAGGETSRVADFTINTVEGDLYQLRLVPSGFAPYVNVGTYETNTGSEIATYASGGGPSDAGDGPQPSTLLFQATKTGPTIIRVTSSAEAGSFQVTVNQVAVAPHPAAGTALAVPGRATVNLVSGGPRTDDLLLYQIFEVELEAGQRIAVDLTTEGGAGDLGDPVVDIGRGTPAAFEALAMDDDSGGFPNARLRFSAPVAGRYLIRARGFAIDTSGRANLAVQLLPPPPPLTVGATQRGTLDSTDESSFEGALHDEYALTLTAGQAVRLEMRRTGEQTTLDPVLTVHRVGATDMDAPLAFNDDMSPETGLDAGLLFVAPADGTYVVRAGTLGVDQNGAYTLDVRAAEPPPPPPAPTPLVPGTPVSGRLDATDPAEPNSNQNFDRYVFEAQAGETYVIELRSTDFDSYVRAGAAGSDPISWSEDDDGGGELNSRLEYRVTTSGPQVIRASALYDGVTEGSYQLTVTRQ